ncbi:LamG-like jellyroll fold domain-containing protein [uncultured Prevotella sp.]|uniref:LamG-like jellyroll fold domain-containing protein n=1 Tax=uncultured Prevotella sp. TaxID=159272 RepID=UPI0026364693|nr:LamG-like jellyroll fold domain-containing protein [uncultured Prevotella sp.]
MVKRRLTGLVALMLPFVFMQAHLGRDKDVDGKKRSKMERAVSTLPDSAYEQVKKEDLLNDEVYIKLARDGWYPQEITRIMDRYIKANRNALRGSREYGMYAKQWLPTYGHTPGNDSIYQFVDTTYHGETMKSVRRLYSRQLEAYYPEIPYTPNDRMQGKRNTGYFRPVQQKPYTGRIHWIVVHPTNPDALMVVPDGGGIFRTDNLGKTWDCVTDRIPDREFRKICAHSAIPVDPDDWNHFFAFMKNGNSTAVYETTDGGQSWTRVEGATHKSFKRGYAFKDKRGNLKFIGAIQAGGNYLGSQLWYSENKGVTWKQIVLPDDMKEVHPETGAKGSFFQNFAFNPDNRDMVYIPTSRSIYYSDDGLTPQSDGSFNLKRMVFDVYNQDGTELRCSQVNEFPYKGTTQSFLEINPNNPLQMWFATSSRNVSYGVNSAVYRSDDGGKTWITLQEPMNGIGSGLAFGNESPWGWLGGFGVNFTDPQWLYGCSMSSAISSDGGHTFKEFAWGNRLKALYDDGQYYPTTSARHNADNHCIVSHRSGRVFRGSDAGLLVKDKDINNYEWTNINSSMGNQLHYSIKVNEFGDQTMLGNTQDVDAQTYRYGRWGHWRGYEGTEAFMNPYAGTCYFSGGGGGGLDDISISSWYEGYTMADVCTGYWYLIHNPGNNSQSFFRIEDFGRKTVNLSANTVDDTGAGTGARDFAITRDGDKSTLFVINTNHTIMRSTDNGQTFETLKVKGSDGSMVQAKFTNAWIAADPNNSNVIYIAQTGKVLKYDLTTGNSEDLSQGLPNISCDDIFFHEGSGDLYFFSSSSGIYLRDHTTGQWSLWLKGYNPLAAKRLALNYTTQEMVIGDYGRGVWVADLEHPSDRYFKNGFALKELSNVNGRRTFGIDTKWTIPLYYDYTWYVNDKDVNNPYQYFTSNLNDGDKVKLKLTLRESPDVSTESAVYTVKSATAKTTVDYSPKPGQALYSNGNGRIDLGNVDYFFNDFTIDFWVNPENDGVILCNRPVELSRDTRGWALLLEQGQLKFRYAPAQMFDRATYDANDAQQTDIVGGTLTKGRWSHVALSEDRDGNVTLYINGSEVASAPRIVQWAPLNSAVNLSLFADGFESMPIKGAVDELKIWNRALDGNDIKRAMFSHDTSDNSSLVYYNDFNAGALDKEQEMFSRVGMAPRVQAVTSYMDMPVAVGAIKSEVKTPQGRTAYDTGNGTAIYITPSGEQSPEFGVYRYANLNPESMGVNSQYYVAASEVFQIRPFSEAGDQTLDIELPLSWQSGKQYQLYACGLYDSQKVWMKVADLEAGEAGKSLVAKGVKTSSIADKMLAVLQNKAAVEPSLDGNWEGNEINVYDRNQISYNVNARLVGGMSEPAGLYEISSKTGLFKIADNMKFVNGKAVAKLQLDMDMLSNAKTLTDVIESKDGSMVPLEIKVNNKMLPVDPGKAMTFQGGGAAVPSSQISSNMNGQSNVTMMGWVRIDSEDMLSGVKPLIFFRGSNGGVCGIHIADKNLRFHWNDGYYGWATTHYFKPTDVGRWMHVALVAASDGFHVYLNGAEYFRSASIPVSKVNSALLLGQNSQGDKWFKGAIDQVMLWNRALSADEVRKYMLDNPRLDAQGLVSFVDMDHKDEEGRIYEVVTETPLTLYGTSSNDDFSHMPYHPTSSFTQNSNDVENGQDVYVGAPQGVNADFRIGVMNGAPYNYANADHADLIPLSNSFYTLTMSKASVFSSGQKAALSFSVPQITSGTDIQLALRPIGSTEPFATYVPMVGQSNDRMRFEVDGNVLNDGCEMMLMYNGTTGDIPVKVELSVDNYADGDTIILNDVTDKITVKSRVISAAPTSKVFVSAVESEYASTSISELNLSGSAEQDIVVTINKDNLNPLAVNPVTINLSGVTDNSELKLKVALEPIVELSLADNDENGNVIEATSPYASFGVKAKLLQGVVSGGIKIRVETDENVTSLVNTSLGSMLSNGNVAYADMLDYYPSASEFDAGWNLIGNPYMSNINLTKNQNVILKEDEVVKYLYQYNPESDTYTAWDMVENYDETQKLMPFQPFFVQTRQPGASLVITPEAKNTSINRRVFDHYMLHESKMLRLGLYEGDSDKLADRTEVKLQDETSAGFVIGEDAVKMWGGLNSKTNEMATVCDNRNMSVNVLPGKQVEIPLYLRLSSTGKFRIAAIKSYGYGLNDKAELLDKTTGQRWNLLDGNGYEFEVNTADEAKSRFVLVLNVQEGTTGIDQVAGGGKPSVSVNGNTCRIDGLTDKSVIEIFDTAGRRRVYTTTSASSSYHQLTSGTYIVRVRMSNKDYTNKINVR